MSGNRKNLIILFEAVIQTNWYIYKTVYFSGYYSDTPSDTCQYLVLTTFDQRRWLLLNTASTKFKEINRIYLFKKKKYEANFKGETGKEEKETTIHSPSDIATVLRQILNVYLSPIIVICL